MRCELPTLVRCCCCFPLRYGLLVWAYIKQILNAFMAFFLSVKIYNDARLNHWIGYNIITSLFLIIILIDIAFTILFIISGHTKDYKKMRIFYRYSIAVLCLYAALFGLCSADTVWYMYMTNYVVVVLMYITGPILMVSVLLLIIQGYMIILIRSEFLKLKNNSQFVFVNQTAEERCAVNIDFENQILDSV